MHILLVKMNSVADEIIPPISLGYLAETVKKTHFVKIIDCLKEDKNENDVAEISKDFDIVGITLFTKDLSLCKKYFTKVKEKNPQIVTIAGGPHPSAVPYETMKFLGNLCDFIFVGESELSFPKLISYLEHKTPSLEEIEGLGYYNNGDIKLNKAIYTEDIDRFKVA